MRAPPTPEPTPEQRMAQLEQRAEDRDELADQLASLSEQLTQATARATRAERELRDLRAWIEGKPSPSATRQETREVLPIGVVLANGLLILSALIVGIVLGAQP